MELKVVDSSGVREKIRDHPCFSKDAHHHYARMHVAVAPACNIQCHYCNRKYDCANESRPGVVSELLTPEQAVKKTLAVAAEIPQLTVLGIAGPGDPLANPERTFATFAALTEKAPDIRLCVSTNGLMLPQHVDELCRHNIDHVTITINCVDADIGAQIYPWIFWQHRRIRGAKAAAILIEQQLMGLEMLAERGVLVKINSVLIPGVNDLHLAEVSRIVKQKGAFLHNIMPLIAEPEHGTFFGLMGQRAPSAKELHAVQQSCANDMEIMSHCRQCRADAIGMLGQDRHDEFTLERIEKLEIDPVAAMARRAQLRAQIEAARTAKSLQPVLVSLTSLTQPKPGVGGSPAAQVGRAKLASSAASFRVALASSDGQRIDQSLSEVEVLRVYQVDGQSSRLTETRPVSGLPSHLSQDPVAEAKVTEVIKLIKDCDALLCTRIGFNAWQRLERQGIRPLSAESGLPIKVALRQAHADWHTDTEGAANAASRALSA
ncbi:FeMo cofactor biosynthesis protein NifB [Thiorhodovibrio winogradskyi]|uniref:FeMo cofactor biosynthesis protein NifB n=1 Tax=Thiorhodovibrio winogradskyi TaxID=77007 RepID=A0ABZ0SAJ0_9GAMM|nr:nitrogenase cofactor biosynthesis protein NifB [Thiorhodovibrio winogradskyi]